jgi:pilus assembly protein Flp/PilA
MLRNNTREDGQGLVEYALILILVAMVAIGILSVLGPQIGAAFSTIINNLEGGVIQSVTAVRTGSETGNDVVVTITVIDNVTVSLTDSQSGQTTTLSCNGTCQHTFVAVGFDAGKVTATADGQSRSGGYGAKH